MTLLDQCKIWNENDEYQKIIEALEAVPAQERTPEMDSELARAYNNQAAPGDRELFRKAIALLKPHEAYFAGDHCWNFRMGYSYYYLDQEGRALPYFQAALEARPGDGDTQEFIEWCQKGVALPRFSECFRERTEAAWEKFAQQEAQLRQRMDEDKDHQRGDELVAQMEDVLHLAFDDISFEMGFNGQKHELILTPEGDKVKLFELVYFQKHAPKKVLEHWNILAGRQPNPGIGLRTDDGWEVSGEDVQVWLEERGKNSFALSAYCEKAAAYAPGGGRPGLVDAHHPHRPGLGRDFPYAVHRRLRRAGGAQRGAVYSPVGPAGQAEGHGPGSGCRPGGLSGELHRL